MPPAGQLSCLFGSHSALTAPNPGYSALWYCQSPQLPTAPAGLWVCLCWALPPLQAPRQLASAALPSYSHPPHGLSAVTPLLRTLGPGGSAKLVVSELLGPSVGGISHGAMTWRGHWRRKTAPAVGEPPIRSDLKHSYRLTAGLSGLTVERWSTLAHAHVQAPLSSGMCWSSYLAEEQMQSMVTAYAQAPAGGEWRPSAQVRGRAQPLLPSGCRLVETDRKSVCVHYRWRAALLRGAGGCCGPCGSGSSSACKSTLRQGAAGPLAARHKPWNPEIRG